MKKCNCDVPDDLHATCCGWANAWVYLDDKGCINDKRHPGHGQNYSEWLSQCSTSAPSLSERAVEERAIAFAEFLSEEGWVEYPSPNESGKHIWHKIELLDNTPIEDGMKSTQQLFALFQQQQSK